MNQKIKELSKKINELEISDSENIESLKQKQEKITKNKNEISKLIKSMEEPPKISIIQLEKGITQNFVDNLIEVQSNDIVSRIIKKNTKKKIYNNIIIPNIINSIVNLEKNTSFAIRKKDEINKKKLLPIYTEIPNILNNIVNTVSSDIVVYNKVKSNITEITKHSINYYDIMKEPNILNGLVELLNDRDYIKINKMNKKDKIEKILLTQKYLPDIINNISTLLINSLFYIKKLQKTNSPKKSIFNYIKKSFAQFRKPSLSMPKFSTPSLSSLSKMFPTASVSVLMDILKASSSGLSSNAFRNMLKSKGFNYSELRNIKKENENSQFIFDFTKYFEYQKNNSLDNFRKFISDLKKNQKFIKILDIFKDSILIYKYIKDEKIFLYINYYGEEIFLSYDNKTSEYTGNKDKIINKPEIESIFKKLTYAYLN